MLALTFYREMIRDLVGPIQTHLTCGPSCSPTPVNCMARYSRSRGCGRFIARANCAHRACVTPCGQGRGRCKSQQTRNWAESPLMHIEGIADLKKNIK